MLSSLLHRGTDHPERHAAFHPEGFIDLTDVTHKQLNHTDPRPHSSAMSGSHSFLTENICFKIITYDFVYRNIDKVESANTYTGIVNACECFVQFNLVLQTNISTNFLPKVSHIYI